MPQVVADIMTAPPVTVPMDATMEAVRSIFETRRFHHLIVTDADRRAVGVISDRDLLSTVSPFVGKMAERSADLASLKRKAHQVMTRRLIAARPMTDLASAARVMLDHHVSCLPVLDPAGRCVGIVTVRDLVRWAIRFAESPGLRDGARRAA